MAERPSVTVIVPFGGDERDAAELTENLATLRLESQDQLIVADNGNDGVLERFAPTLGAEVVAARHHRSSYSARNVAVDHARGQWLLFTDADCRPEPDLLDRLFMPTPADNTGLVVGSVLPVVRNDTSISRYAITRSANEQDLHVAHPYLPFGATANLLVRRVAFEAVGGFHDGVRSGGDADLCWRVQAAGWGLEYRPHAPVHHRQRETARAIVRQHLRYGAGGRWLKNRHPNANAAPLLPRIARAIGGGARRLIAGRPREALFRLVDAGVICLEGFGRLMANRNPDIPPAATDGSRRVAILVDAFPELSETFIASEARALIDLGARIRIEAVGRAQRPDRTAARGLDVRYVEDDGVAGRLAALWWLIQRSPRACLTDLVARRRWRALEDPLPLRALAPLARRVVGSEDEHLHAHFGVGAALNAMRLHNLLGVPYSVTLHGYDIFQSPRNLDEKLSDAVFATSGSDYTVGHLRQRHPQAASRVHRIVMGVDPTRWTRTRPPAAVGTVVAVGRLVEKKGFATLLRAAAMMRDDACLERVIIVGEGPLRADLAALHADLDLGDRVVLSGARSPAEVRELLETAAVVAIPCVIAADGDSDSMPVIAKEALAMEVPIVASDVAGLPEVVCEAWGRLVPPADPVALAAALREILAMDPQQRAAMGARGRDFVERDCSTRGEARKLLALIDAAVDPVGGSRARDTPRGLALK